MKTFTKRIIAVGVLLCVAMSGIVGCSNTQQNSNSSDEEAVLQIPFTIDDGDKAGIDDPNKDSALDNDDPTEPASGAVSTTAAATAASGASTTTTAAVQDTTEIQTVTNADGQPVTEVVTVTDDKGAVVTDAKGETVTSVAYVTTIVRNKSAKTEGTQAANATTEAAAGTQAVVTDPIKTGSDYQSKTQSKYAMWLDISKDENFYFEGDFITVEFKVKEDIPDGDYKIRISPDLSDIAGKTISPGKVTDGLIRVNNGQADAIDASSETADNFYYGDQIACKQGDTVEFKINVKNNTGLAAFFMWFYYDSNALEVVDAYPSGEFAKIAKSTEFGSPKNAEE